MGKIKNIFQIITSKDYILITKYGNSIQAHLDENLTTDKRVNALNLMLRNMQAAIRRIEARKDRSINFIETGRKHRVSN